MAPFDETLTSAASTSTSLSTTSSIRAPKAGRDSLPKAMPPTSSNPRHRPSIEAHAATAIRDDYGFTTNESEENDSFYEDLDIDGDKVEFSEIVTLLPPPSCWFERDEYCNEACQSGINAKGKKIENHHGDKMTSCKTNENGGMKGGEVVNKEDAEFSEFQSARTQGEEHGHQSSTFCHNNHDFANFADFSKLTSDLPAWNSAEARMFDVVPTSPPSTLPSHSTDVRCDSPHKPDNLETKMIIKNPNATSISNISNTSMTENPETLPTLATAVEILSTTLSQTLLATSTTLSQTLPALLRECSSSTLTKSYRTIRLEYARMIPHQRYLRATEIGSVGGYFRPELVLSDVMEVNDKHEIGNSRGNIRSEKNGKLIGDLTDTFVAMGKGRDDRLDWMWMDGTEVRFSTLPWIERQLVHEWRTYQWTTNNSSSGIDEEEEEYKSNEEDDGNNETKHDDSDPSKFGARRTNNESGNDTNESIANQHQNTGNCESEDDDDEEMDNLDLGDYERARTLAPRPLPRPEWEHANSCYLCRGMFGPTLHRHHCRRCGHSFCNTHSNYFHRLPHLGYDIDVAERVCRSCKVVLDSRDLEERVAWRLARCRDFLEGNLTPYFETGVDTVEDAAYRLTRVAIKLARSIPLGAQAYVAVETVEVLRKHGLKGVYGLLLRKEFLAAADLLCRVLGINKKNWPLSVHELSAAIFYALAQHRALRGLRPDGEESIHSLKCNSHFGSQGSCKNNGPSTEDLDVSGGIISNEKLWSSSSFNDSNILGPISENCFEEDDEAGDTIVWEGHLSKIKCHDFTEPVLDETDIYDPRTERVVDLVAVSNPQQEMTAGKSHQNKAEGISHVLKQREKQIIYESTSKPLHQMHTDRAETLRLPFEPVCEPVSDSLLSSLLFYAPLALNFIYAECEVDMQLLAAQQGWRLVYASLDQNHHHAGEEDGASLESTEIFSDKPASALFAHDEHKIACFSIRGTATIQDVVTDIRALPVPFPQHDDDEDNKHKADNTAASKLDNIEWTSIMRGQGLALCGMAGAASNLFRENADSLLYLALKGYKIRIVGHSLGGGVAALLGVLVSEHLEKCCIQVHEKFPNEPPVKDDGFLRVYGYGTPSCVDARLADFTRTYVTNVVMHDDVIPRLTPTSIRGLLKHLLYIRETWVKAHLSDDLSAITERAYHVWPTRLRSSFTLLKKKGVASAKKLKKSCRKKLRRETKSMTSMPGSATKDVHEYDNSLKPDQNGNASNHYESDHNDEIGVDEGVDVEGDLFFDPIEDPLNESDDDSSVDSEERFNRTSHTDTDNDWVPFDEPPMDPPSCSETKQCEKKETQSLHSSTEDNLSNSMPSNDAHMLEEFPLPRMFIPGKIVHIYTHRGGYKAAFVPRKFRQLRRISLAGNMLSDHMAKAYYEGLLEVKAIRAANQDLPPWVGFGEDITCACCASNFTWASTSNSEAQAARDKHNCRSCGGLVCDPCSKKRVPIPSIGITAPVRVCDRCYNGWGSLYGNNDSNESTRNVMESIDIRNSGEGSVRTHRKFERIDTKYSRRSIVVDELASRIPSINV